MFIGLSLAGRRNRKTGNCVLIVFARGWTFALRGRLLRLVSIIVPRFFAGFASSHSCSDTIANLECGAPGESDSCWWLNSTKTKYTAVICVCDSCRLSAGVDIIPLTYVPKINVKHTDGSVITGYEFGTIKAYRSSAKAVRYFCARCSACVFFVADNRPALPDIHIGLFDAKSGALAEDWLDWKTEKLSYQEDGNARGSLADDVATGMKDWEVRKRSP